MLFSDDQHSVWYRFDKWSSEECMNLNGIPYVQDHIHNIDFKIHNQLY